MRGEANLRGASPVGRDEGDRPYVTQAVSSSGAESVVSRRANAVSRRREVVLRTIGRRGAGLAAGRRQCEPVVMSTISAGLFAEAGEDSGMVGA